MVDGWHVEQASREVSGAWERHSRSSRFRLDEVQGEEEVHRQRDCRGNVQVEIALVDVCNLK